MKLIYVEKNYTWKFDLNGRIECFLSSCIMVLWFCSVTSEICSNFKRWNSWTYRLTGKMMYRLQMNIHFSSSASAQPDFYIFTLDFRLCIDKGEPHTKVRKKCSFYCCKCIKCCSIIGLFGEIIFTIISLYWVVIKTSLHKSKCWDLFTSMPKPQRACGSEDRTGRLWGRSWWNLKKMLSIGSCKSFHM